MNAPAAQFLPDPPICEDTGHCNFLVRCTDGLPATHRDPPHIHRQCAGERGHGQWGSWCKVHANYMDALKRKTQN